MTASAIAEQTGIPARTVSDAVNRLIERKVVARPRNSPRGPVRLVKAAPQSDRRGRPKTRTSPGGSPLAAFWEQAKTDPEGTINAVTVVSYLGLGLVATVAYLFGKPLVGLVATRVAHDLRTAPPKPGMWPATPPAASNGHSDAPAAPTGLRVVKPPAHLDPNHVCILPLPGMGLQVGQAWICNQERGTGCGHHWTWTGEGWTPWQMPAGFKAREKLNASWLGGSRDFYVQSSRTSTALSSSLAVQSDLQRRIAEYAARRPEPGALRTLQNLAAWNPRRADAILRRAGH